MSEGPSVGEDRGLHGSRTGGGIQSAATKRKGPPNSRRHHMADPRVLTTHRRKQAEIENAIAAYEKRAEEARRDLAAINAAMRLLSVEPGAEHVASLHGCSTGAGRLSWIMRRWPS